MRIALGIEYNGSKFHGWQKQPDKISVQQVIEHALSKFCGHSVSTYVAGRTDAGVHALEQIIHFETSVIRAEFSWLRGVNSFLRAKNYHTIKVLWARQVSNEFHARFSAVGRTYYYVLFAGTAPSACFAGQVGYILDSPVIAKLHNQEDNALHIDLMLQSAKYLMGQKDFSSFRSSICQAKSPVKTMYKIDIINKHPWYIFEFSANAFLHHMVRNILACLIKVGQGKKPPQWLDEVLKSKNRNNAAPTFMPDGLYLASIDYADIKLPQIKPKLPWQL